MVGQAIVRFPQLEQQFDLPTQTHERLHLSCRQFCRRGIRHVDAPSTQFQSAGFGAVTLLASLGTQLRAALLGDEAAVTRLLGGSLEPGELTKALAGAAKSTVRG